MAKSKLRAEKAKKEEEKKEEGHSDVELSSEEEEFKGFESTDDEDNVEEGESTSTVVKSSKSKDSDESGPKRGVLYVGRIPHGFYEEQLRKYFSQFGTITRLRVSRNKHTGKSKHYAFVEFEDEEVAKVVTETMDNYLLFGHILQVKAISADKVHPDVWKGANRKYSPAERKEPRSQKRPLNEWESIQKTFETKKLEKLARLESMGIKYSLDDSTTPKKSTKTKETFVPKKKSRKVSKSKA